MHREGRHPTRRETCRVDTLHNTMYLQFISSCRFFLKSSGLERPDASGRSYRDLSGRYSPQIIIYNSFRVIGLFEK